MRVLLSLALCAVLMTSTAAAASPFADPHLRPQDDRLKQLIRAGMARSVTLKSLVERIEASNVYVYVVLNPLMKRNLSGMLTFMTRAGEYRYLRASISQDLSPDQMIATIAHELQHAVEVIEDETVSDDNSLVALYRRIGRQLGNSSPMRWETTAAQQTGFQVRKELFNAPSTTLARASEAIR